MSINLKQFQLNAIKQLDESMQENTRDIVLKSPTGSGKTIILTHFMDQYIKSNHNIVFVWLTPGKGNLEEQSKEKMDKYIHNSQTKLLADIMTSGFEENDCCFINWEKLTKKGNVALKDSERTNFLEHIEKAFYDGLQFKVIIDESHQNFTAKADEIVQYFKTDKIIRCSATPLIDKRAKLIEISEADVIAEGLIKKLVVINENFPQKMHTDNPTNYLLEKAVEKQQELKSLYLQNNLNINPLIIVQLPNNSDLLLDNVEKFFESRGISYENNNLALWISGKHENLANISKNDGEQIAIIIKQAVATGWDCPRASILVKLRDNMDETFEIQTIGRIRRMPEAKHYQNDILDSCYLYTLDSKFTAGAKSFLGNYALESKTLFLKNEYKDFTLIKEQKSFVSTRDSRQALLAIYTYFKQKFNLSKDKEENKTKLENSGFDFSSNIINQTISGSTSMTDKLKSQDFNKVDYYEHINTNTHGREYHHQIAKMGMNIGLNYEFMNTIIRNLFCQNNDCKYKLLELPVRNFYAFVINNAKLLTQTIRLAMAEELQQQAMDLTSVVRKTFTIPYSTMFTFDASCKLQEESDKNVYNGYLLPAEPRSLPEKKFEKFCENCESVSWFYKNGDKGEEYLSILYYDNGNNPKLFYPDYILSSNDEIWIVETKGGFDKNGISEDIDVFSPKKFNVLKRYVQKYNLKGGFVRFDEKSDELCICTENYNEDIQSNDWQFLKDVFKKNK